MDEYRLIKPFAVELFREITRIIGKEAFVWIKKMRDIERRAREI